MNDITLVSVNWNQQPALKLMLYTYVKCHYKDAPLNLVLVDNGSTDGSVEWLKQSGIPFISLPQNIGHEQAINLIYPMIKTRFALICDTDVMFRDNVYEAHINDLRNETCLVGDYITGDQLNAPVKPRVGAWFFMYDIGYMREQGVYTFRASNDWSYDVGSWMTEKILETGEIIKHTPRLNKDIDRDLFGMDYGTHVHFGKVSWDLQKHGDRTDEVNIRRKFIENYRYTPHDFKNKFVLV